MGREVLQKILTLLKNSNIEFKHQTHETINRDSVSASKIRGSNLNQGAKALILKTKSKKFVQMVLPANLRLDLKKAKLLVGEKNISLASPDEVLELTTCVVGSVPPFGILWNIPTYFDKLLLDKELLVFSSGTLEDSIFIKPHDLINCNKGIVATIIKTPRH